MINNSTNITKTNNHLSTKLIAHIWRWKSISWRGTDTKLWRG